MTSNAYCKPQNYMPTIQNQDASRASLCFLPIPTPATTVATTTTIVIRTRDPHR
jgi:hypothetical protein